MSFNIAFLKKRKAGGSEPELKRSKVVETSEPDRRETAPTRANEPKTTEAPQVLPPPSQTEKRRSSVATVEQQAMTEATPSSRNVFESPEEAWARAAVAVKDADLQRIDKYNNNRMVNDMNYDLLWSVARNIKIGHRLASLERAFNHEKSTCAALLAELNGMKEEITIARAVKDEIVVVRAESIVVDLAPHRPRHPDLHRTGLQMVHINSYFVLVYLSACIGFYRVAPFIPNYLGLFRIY